MKIRLRKLLLSTVFSGSVLGLSSFISYGMELKELSSNLKEKNKKVISKNFSKEDKNNEEIFFLSRIERKIKQRNQKEYKKFSGVTLSREPYFEAIKSFLCDAEEGDLSALYNVGWLLQQRREKNFFFVRVHPPYKKRNSMLSQRRGNNILEKASAFYWWVKDNHQEDPQDWYELGRVYANGQSTEQDFEKASDCFRKAADYNHAAAQAYLGYLYLNGHGVIPDYVEAKKWLKKAADQNNAWAQYVIGWLYCKGIGVRQNKAKAMKWFWKTPAQLNGQEFANCNFRDEDASHVAILLLRAYHLTTINLEENKFTTQGLKLLLEAFFSHPALEEVYLGDTPTDDEGGKEIIALLKKKPFLRIHLLSNYMNEELIHSIKKISVLRKNPADLCEHDFLGCNFTDEDAPQVVSLLSRAFRLTKINLEGNRFTPQGLKLLLKNFWDHPALEEVCLGVFPIDDKVEKKVLALFEKKPPLRIHLLRKY